ncbi:MAG: hypothetical protein GEV09_04205 [Pseudonocardiaceae bacterium]|nr:hypothetical protein [Pseudonocardiaceae bacterium]
MITTRQSAAEIAALQRRLSETEHDPAAHVEALRAALALPCSQHGVSRYPELWARLSRALGALSDYDDAIDAIEAGNEHGTWASPHPEPTSHPETRASCGFARVATHATSTNPARR